MAYINFFLNFLLSFLSCKNCINNCFLADDLHITTAQEVEQGGMHTSQVQSNTNECALRCESLKGQDSEKKTDLAEKVPKQSLLCRKVSGKWFLRHK